MEQVSILIPAYNCENTIAETLDSCRMQEYSNLEILVSDNCSTDHTVDIVSRYPEVILEKGLINIGGALNMEKCIKLATGKYVVFMCSDDLFTNPKVVSDIVEIFIKNPKVGYIGRYYYQFINGYKGAVRTHRTNNPYFSADNPSGLAFRKEALSGNVVNKVFIEAASIVKEVLDKGWDYKIIRWVTTAIRIGNNNSRKSETYKYSPVLNWINLIGKQKFLLTSYVSFIQIKNWSSYRNVFREIWYFIILKPSNLFRPDFWFFALIAIFIPRYILRHITDWFKHRICRLFVKEIKHA